ncbi:MAG: hypothetical protein WAM97_04130, partial [Acidimicrobiales bacterium]
MPAPMPMPRARPGTRSPDRTLYDPQFEHDACGIALVADLTASPSHRLVDQALTALERLDHRGAKGADENTGDGAGILTQIPDEFLRGVVDFELPEVGHYATGTVFLPQDPDDATKARSSIAEIALQESLTVLGWREIPTVPDQLGDAAVHSMPAIWQLFVATNQTTDQTVTTAQTATAQTATATTTTDPALFLDRLSFCLRKRIEHELNGVYIPSLSARTLVYKGMLTSLQLR